MRSSSRKPTSAELRRIAKRARKAPSSHAGFDRSSASRRRFASQVRCGFTACSALANPFRLCALALTPRWRCDAGQSTRFSPLFATFLRLWQSAPTFRLVARSPLLQPDPMLRPTVEKPPGQTQSKGCMRCHNRKKVADRGRKPAARPKRRSEAHRERERYGRTTASAGALRCAAIELPAIASVTKPPHERIAARSVREQDDSGKHGKPTDLGTRERQAFLRANSVPGGRPKRAPRDPTCRPPSSAGARP